MSETHLAQASIDIQYTAPALLGGEDWEPKAGRLIRVLTELPDHDKVLVSGVRQPS